jgi:hypothetical protein
MTTPPAANPTHPNTASSGSLPNQHPKLNHCKVLYHFLEEAFSFTQLLLTALRDLSVYTFNYITSDQFKSNIQTVHTVFMTTFCSNNNNLNNLKTKLSSTPKDVPLKHQQQTNLLDLLKNLYYYETGASAKEDLITPPRLQLKNPNAVRGIVNTGCTCYLATTLQHLSNHSIYDSSLQIKEGDSFEKKALKTQLIKIINLLRAESTATSPIPKGEIRYLCKLMELNNWYSFQEENPLRMNDSTETKAFFLQAISFEEIPLGLEEKIYYHIENGNIGDPDLLTTSQRIPRAELNIIVNTSDSVSYVHFLHDSLLKGNAKQQIFTELNTDGERVISPTHGYNDPKETRSYEYFLEALIRSYTDEELTTLYANVDFNKEFSSSWENHKKEQLSIASNKYFCLNSLNRQKERNSIEYSSAKFKFALEHLERNFDDIQNNYIRRLNDTLGEGEKTYITTASYRSKFTIPPPNIFVTVENKQASKAQALPQHIHLSDIDPQYEDNTQYELEEVQFHPSSCHYTYLRKTNNGYVLINDSTVTSYRTLKDVPSYVWSRVRFFSYNRLNS